MYNTIITLFIFKLYKSYTSHNEQNMCCFVVLTELLILITACKLKKSKKQKLLLRNPAIQANIVVGAIEWNHFRENASKGTNGNT